MTEDRYTEMLPFYVNGTLNAEDRAAVESWLAEHPEHRGELEWWRSVKERMDDPALNVSDEIGLERTMERIHADKRAANLARAEAPAPRRASRGFFDTLREWVASISPAPVMAAAAVVIAIQGGFLAHFAMQGGETSEFRSVPGDAAASGPVVKVNFKADAREEEIRMLLVDVQGTLAGGPGQLGDWYVRVPAGRTMAAIEKLKAASVVESAELVDGVPPRD